MLKLQGSKSQRLAAECALSRGRGMFEQGPIAMVLDLKLDTGLIRHGPGFAQSDRA